MCGGGVCVEVECAWRWRSVCGGGGVCGGGVCGGGVCVEVEECVWRWRSVCGGGGVCVEVEECVGR